jgi:hypothetical protein
MIFFYFIYNNSIESIPILTKLSLAIGILHALLPMGFINEKCM